MNINHQDNHPNNLHDTTRYQYQTKSLKNSPHSLLARTHLTSDLPVPPCSSNSTRSYSKPKARSRRHHPSGPKLEAGNLKTRSSQAKIEDRRSKIEDRRSYRVAGLGQVSGFRHSSLVILNSYRCRCAVNSADWRRVYEHAKVSS